MDPTARQLEFMDLDAYVGRTGGYEGIIRQIGSGALSLVQDELVLDGVQILRWSTSRTLSSSLAFDSQWTIVGAARSKSAPAVRSNGVELSGDDLVVASHADEFQNFEPAGTSVIEVAIRNDLLAASGLLPGGPDDVPSRPELGRFTMSPYGAESYRSCMNSLIDLAAWSARHGQPMPVHARDAALEIVAGAFTSAAVGNGPAHEPELPSAYEWVGRVLEELRSDASHDLDLVAMASRVGTTPRTLQRAFGQVIGTSPYQYMLRHRLNDARQELIGQPHVTVTEVAHRFGFTSSGFAHQFRRLFGNRPSDARDAAALRNGSSEAA